MVAVRNMLGGNKVTKTKNELIRVIPLGGVGEIGKSMYVIEIDEELFVVDSGLMFPEDEMLGICGKGDCGLPSCFGKQKSVNGSEHEGNRIVRR